MADHDNPTPLIPRRVFSSSFNGVHDSSLDNYVVSSVRRPTYITASLLLSAQLSPPPKTRAPVRPSLGKLADSREKALRFIRSALSSHSKNEDLQVQPRRPSQASLKAESDEMPAVDFLRNAHRAHNGSSTHLPTSRRPSLFDEPSLTDSIPAAERARAGSTATERARAGSLVSDRARSGSINISDDKPLASAGGVSVGINLAEPVLFLQGYDVNDSSNRSTAMLRGSLHLRVTKAAKIKAVTLKFKGVATTRWPEGWFPVDGRWQLC